MKFANLLKVLGALVLAVVFTNTGYAQGVTSATILGLVTDANGEPLIGANVVAIHGPSGTFYGNSTREDGRFTLPNVRIGGPYTIKVSYTGYEDKEEKDVTLSLGQSFRINFSMQETATELQAVEVIAIQSEILNGERTGAATNIKNEVINTLPTFSRSLNDFIRLTPQSKGSAVASTTGGGTSFAGQDSRFNNLTIDGSIFNNSFGLASAPAGQTNSTPISLDALDEIQVNVAPFDVRQGGFTGAGVNAVTRSGTNQLEGSVFHNLRNQNLIGTKIDGKDVFSERIDNGSLKFNIQQTGFRLGGPIIKNKLFFFVNAEIERRTDPATTFIAFRDSVSTPPADANVTRVRASDMDALKQFLINTYGYDPGSYEGYDLETSSDKALIKFDYNINNNHRVSLRYNYLRSFRDVPASNSGSFQNRSGNKFALNFSNSNYIINNDIHSVIAELNSIFGSKVSNSLQVGFTANRDYRSSGGGIFPLVDILEGGRNLTTFGFEPFTPNNILNTDTWQIQDNLTFYAGAHTITAGVNLEAFKFENTFTPTYYGQYVFNSLEDFYKAAAGDQTVQLRRFQQTYSALPGGALPTATTKAYQPGVYLQDEVDLLDNRLKVTAGIRLDMPFFDQSALNNPVVDTMVFRSPTGENANYSTDQLPEAQILFSPRIGFNWDVQGNRSLQVRGGTGVFSGRPAFVWISNQVGNNGILTGSIFQDNTTAYPFSTDVTTHIPDNATTPTNFSIAISDPNFKWPQVWRSNIGIDFKLPFDLVGTLEGIYSKTLNNVMYNDVNQRPAAANFTGADDRPYYAASTNARRLNARINDAILLFNTDEGYSYSLTAKLERQFKNGWYAMAAYNFGEAKDLITAGSIAFSSWRDNRSVLGNNFPGLAFSDQDQRHRVIGAVSYRIEYLKALATTVSLFFQSNNLDRFSFFYNGDMNSDGAFANDLMYVPTNATDANEILFKDITNGPTAAQQAEAFEAFIQNDEYLSSIRGQYTERNGAIRPWVSTLDLSVQQEFFLKVGARRHTLQARLDISNIGNMINDSWGVGTTIVNGSPLRFDSRNAEGRPVYQFTQVAGAFPTKALDVSNNLIDVWQMQFGVRYIF